MITDWDMFKEFVISDFSYRSLIHNCNEYLMSTDDNNASHVESKRALVFNTGTK